MKLLIAGGRDFEDKELFYSTLCDRGDILDESDPYYMPFPDLVIVHGDAQGADSLADDFAITHWTGIKVFPAEWDKYGRSAGFIRNKEMAEYADELLAFWDGNSKGTAHMINTMESLGKPVQVVRYE